MKDKKKYCFHGVSRCEMIMLSFLVGGYRRTYLTNMLLRRLIKLTNEISIYILINRD